MRQIQIFGLNFVPPIQTTNSAEHEKRNKSVKNLTVNFQYLRALHNE